MKIERYINFKLTKSKKKFSNIYTYVIMPYNIDTIQKLKELNLYFDIIDIYVHKYYNYKIEMRIYKQKSYFLVAFLYKFLKDKNIDNFKIIEYNDKKGIYVLVDSTTIIKKLSKNLF